MHPLKQAVHSLGFTITDAFCHSMIGMPARYAMRCFATISALASRSPILTGCIGECIDAALRTAVPLKPGCGGTAGCTRTARAEEGGCHIGRAACRRNAPQPFRPARALADMSSHAMMSRAASLTRICSCAPHELLDVAPNECPWQYASAIAVRHSGWHAPSGTCRWHDADHGAGPADADRRDQRDVRARPARPARGPCSRRGTSRRGSRSRRQRDGTGFVSRSQSVTRDCAHVRTCAGAALGERVQARDHPAARARRTSRLPRSPDWSPRPRRRCHR